MKKITIYVKDIDTALEVKDWLRENVGWENYKEWIGFVPEANWDPRGMRRTYSFKNPEHETLFMLRWL